MEKIYKNLKLKIDALENYIKTNYKNNFREPGEKMKHQFLVPGASYSKQLWDWDSWLTGLALLEIDAKGSENYQKGCVLNFLDAIGEDGRIPILISEQQYKIFDVTDKITNIHKPCLAQHALAISKKYKDVRWIEKDFSKLLRFLNWYHTKQKDEESGLYFWIDDLAIGFDNDPTVFYRPTKSTGAIYLNCLMYKELLATKDLAQLLGKKKIVKEYEERARKLKDAINNECFDNVDGFYYSVDLSLRKVDPNDWLHRGCPRFWHSLPIKIKTWASMLPLWAGICDEKHAQTIINNFIKNSGLKSKFGIRSVSNKEKMYKNIPSGNPSCWLGPIWINANYFLYEGLKNYGFKKLANQIAVETINLLGTDVIKNKEFHEYYDSDTGLGILNKGFQSWNFLVYNIIKELKGKYK